MSALQTERAASDKNHHQQERTLISVHKLNVNPKLWDTKQGKVSGKSKVATELNGLMSDMESSISSDVLRYVKI